VASGLDGAAITLTQATASDTLVGGQGVHLLVTNTSGSNTVVTLITPETVEGSLAVTDRVVTVATATTWEIPVPSRYNDATTGIATVTFSAFPATVLRAAVQGSCAP
jgi:hypothetical protein